MSDAYQNNKTKKSGTKERVLIAINGGISSTVAAYLLNKQGYECIAVALDFFNKEDKRYLATAEQLPWVKPANIQSMKMDQPLFGRYHIDDLERVKEIAEKLDVTFYAVNAQGIYFDHVTEYVVSSRLSGASYSPLVDATTTIFDVLLEKAEKLGCTKIATGHYAKILHNKTTGHEIVYTSNDNKNDQSDLLSRLTQKHLQKIILPLAEMRREDVEKIGSTLGISFVDRQSQKMSSKEFMHDHRLGAVVQNFSSEDLREEGDIFNYMLDISIGTHEGIHQFYLGQNKLAHKYNLSIDKNLSVLEVYPGGHIVLAGNMDIMNYQTIHLSRFLAAADFDYSRPSKVFIKIDGQDEKFAGTLRFKNNENVIIDLASEQPGIIPRGEYITLYNIMGKGARVLGSGVVLNTGMNVNEKLRYLPSLDPELDELTKEETEMGKPLRSKLSDDIHHF